MLRFSCSCGSKAQTKRLIPFPLLKTSTTTQRIRRKGRGSIGRVLGAAFLTSGTLCLSHEEYFQLTLCLLFLNRCGNGLLVHILVSEGYTGEGIDLRARQSWRHYPPKTQAHLHVHALNPLDLPISSPETVPVTLSPFLKPGTFIIANHADELSPWTPVLATLSGASGFLSIPCCSWSFDARFDRAQISLDQNRKISHEVPFALAPPDDIGGGAFVESLRLGGTHGDARKSAYAAYRVWLACLGVQCGWSAEPETLRIPSTRNWALVGTSYFALRNLS